MTTKKSYEDFICHKCGKKGFLIVCDTCDEGFDDGCWEEHQKIHPDG